MDGAKAGREKAVLPLPAVSDADAAESSAAARQTPLSDAAAAVHGGAGAGTGGEEQEDDDEQVERFYALLANIRAMRGAYVAGGDGTVGSGARKRLRGAEPPWRPAFRLEDFEEPSPSPANKSKRRLEADDAENGARPAVAPSSSSPPRRAGVRSSSSSKSI